MKLVNIFSVLGLVAMATACGSSQPTTNALSNGIPYGTTGYPTTGYPTNGYGSVLIGGQQMVYGTSLSVSANVNAGDRINVNLGSVTYSVGQATCDGAVDTTLYGVGGTHQLSNVSLTLNGQSITGSTQVATSGVLTLTATLTPISIDCSWIYSHRAAVVSSYMVNLGYAVTR